MASTGELVFDTTECFNQHFANKTFDCWEDFQVTLKTFQDETNSVFIKRQTTTVESANKTRKEPIPERFKYSHAPFFCRHYGQPRKQGTGQRKCQRYLAMNCPVHFTVAYSRGSLRVAKKIMMCHQNHTLNAEKNRSFDWSISDITEDKQQSSGSCFVKLEEHLDDPVLSALKTSFGEVVERVSVTTPDFAYTSNLLRSVIKRKTDQCDSPTNSKMLTLKPPSINSGEINENNTSFFSSSLSDTNSYNSLSHDARVDNSDFSDYKITINQDFYSEEDIKPDVDELNAKIHEKDKPAGPVDMRLDKNLLDQRLKEKPSYSKTLPAYDGNPLAIKEELSEEDANLLPIERCNEDLLLTDRNKFSLNNGEHGWSQSVAAEPDTDKVYGSDGNRYCTNCKQHLQSFYSNVHQLLNLLCPDTSLGNVEDIEQTVQTMIHSHKERSQSLSQNFEIQRP